MSNPGDRTDRPPNPGDPEFAAEIADDADALLATLPHYYRGEVTQATSAHDRIDQSTNWAITVLIAVLSVAFSAPDRPAYLLLIGIVALSIFLSYEVRRYRYFDVYRARVRFFQENVFANALEPTGAVRPDWRAELSNDLRYPTFKVSTREALSRRLHRIYGLLFAVIGLAWIAKITLFTPETQWTEAAEIPGIPGAVVAGALVAFYLAIFAIAEWPSNRQAKGEVYGEETGDWKKE